MGWEVGAFLLKAAFWSAVSYGVSELAKDDYDNSVTEEKDPGIKANTRSTQEIKKIVYGETMIGGNDVYGFVGGSENKDLWIVTSLAEGECDSIKQISGEYQIFLGEQLISDFGSDAEFFFYTGSGTQTYDTNLNAVDPNWTENRHYNCYIIYHLIFDRDKFSNLPKRTLVLKGRKLFDFRDSTTAWSQNPVLALYDYMINGRYGMGIDSSLIDITSWTSVANYCDIKGWTINLAISDEDYAIDIIDRILSLFRGGLNWFDGKWYLRYQDYNYESIAGTINDYQIAQGEDGKAQISVGEGSKFQIPDGLRVKYIDPDRDYVTDDVIVGDESGVIKELKLLGHDSRDLAAKMGTYHLERMKLHRTVSGIFLDECQQYEPYDLILLTSSALGLASQLMRIDSSQIRSDGYVEMTLRFDAATLYDDIYNIDTEGIYQCSLPDRYAEPPSVANVQIAEEIYDYRGRSFTRLKITFDEPSNYPWYSHVEVRLSYDDSTWKFLFDAINDFNIDNVEEGAHYYVRLKTVSIWHTKQQDSNDYKIDKIIAGLYEAPASLTGLTAIVSQMAINLYASGYSGSDIAWVEFRLGSSWSGGIFLGRQSYANFSLPGVKPGAHSFIANTLSNNGEYGSTPQTVTAEEIQDPPDGWSLTDSDTCDYTSGTHSNTERITSGPYTDYLKCSHTAGVLTGTYTSPEYDLGTSTRVLVYALAEVVVTGGGTTWDDKFPSSTDWSEGNVDTKTWNQIFSLTEAPQITMKIKYGNVSGSLNNNIEHAEILSGIVTARYFQVEITITDPSASVNALVEDFTIKYNIYS